MLNNNGQDTCILFHTMACFYVIHRYVFSEWRSIRPVEINQYDTTMITHYNITMGNDVAMCTYHMTKLYGYDRMTMV